MTIKKSLKDLTTFTAKCFIACSILFTFISIGLWNVELQTIKITEHGQTITQKVVPVQCLTLKILLTEWIYER